MSVAASHPHHTHTHHDDSTTHTCTYAWRTHKEAPSKPCGAHDICVTHITLRATHRFCTSDVITQMMCHIVDHMLPTYAMCIQVTSRTPSRLAQFMQFISNHMWHQQHVSAHACQRTCMSLTCMWITCYIICHVVVRTLRVTGHSCISLYALTMCVSA